LIKLREYQRTILNNEIIVMILKYLSGKGELPKFLRPLVVSPTGSGKTLMFCALANWCKERKLRVLILVHRKEILRQTVKSLMRIGITCGQIAVGKPMTHDLIQVCMVGTLLKRLGTVKKYDLTITDEAHHTTSPSYRRILSYWPSVPNIGFTATSERLDGAGLGGDYDSMILGPSSQWLVSEGFLAHPIVFRPPEEVDTNYHIKRGDFDQAEQQAVMSQKKIVGDVITHYKKYMDGQPVIVSCVSVAHAKMMAEVFTGAGYRSRAVWGDMSDNDREYAIQGLGNGDVQVVTFDSLISEGVDIPAIAGVILLRKTLSLSLFLQIVGRALRPVYADGFDLETKEGRREAQINGPKPKAIILDHAGNYKIHGHVLADREWSLDSKKRSVKGELPPTTRQCPQCYGVWPGRPQKCPSCGYSFIDAEFRAKAEDIKVIAGELVEAGLDDKQADTEAQWLARIMAMDGKKRQSALLGRAFELSEKEGGRETIKALVKAIGYKEKFSEWAWDWVQSKKKSKAV